MNPKSSLFIDPPELSDEAAAVMLNFLYALATAFENHYYAQLRRYHEPELRAQYDLFEDVNGDPPPF